jgi:hypothetical protein
MHHPHHALQIPAPCHEDWNTMTQNERGRHCAQCNKTVRDFTNTLPEAILAEVTNNPGKICARISRSAITPALLHAQTWIRFPAERLRIFVLAFVLVFGLEVWGISRAQARTVQPAVDNLKNPENLQAAVQDTATEIIIKGKVVDVYTREPVEMAQIILYQKGSLVKGTFTDEEGKFEIKLPKDTLSMEDFDLHLHYMGKTRTDLQIASDAREFLYLIDASGMIDGIAIAEPRIWEEDNILLGQLITESSCSLGLQAPGRTLFRPLDEWLIMNLSEIKPVSRW